VLGTQYGATSRIATFSAGIAMIFLLLFGTGFIIYLPVPVLTAIIISALISAIEITLARRLWKISKREFLIFISAFFGVLIFGTIDGVVIGVILSFFSVLVATMSPLRDYRGVIPGKHHFYSIERNRQAFPISNVLIYKYTGNLHFANIASFVRDIEEGMNADTRVVVIDGAGINHIDTSAAERIEILYEKLKKDGIKFYFTEHIAHINDEFRRLGLGYLIEEGAVRRNIALALEDAGIHRPYPLDGARDLPEHVPEASPIDGMLMEEYEWAFGFRDVIPKQDGDNK
jgi:MFS superfamily sulfate permease-like transporter